MKKIISFTGIVRYGLPSPSRFPHRQGVVQTAAEFRRSAAFLREKTENRAEYHSFSFVLA